MTSRSMCFFDFITRDTLNINQRWWTPGDPRLLEVGLKVHPYSPCNLSMPKGRVAKSLSALVFSTVWTPSVSMLSPPQIRDHLLCIDRRECASSILTINRWASAVYVPRYAERVVRCRAFSRLCSPTGVIVCRHLTRWSPKRSATKVYLGRTPTCTTVNKPSP